MTVFEAVEAELAALGDGVAGSALGATALSLAAGMDAPSSLTSKSMCAKALADVLREVRSLAPARRDDDELSRLREARDRRRSGMAAAQDSPGS